MSISEENKQEKESQPEFENFTDDIPLFILPDDDLLTLPDDRRATDKTAIDNAAPIEEIPEANFEFSTYNIKPEKKPIAVSTPTESTGETMRKTGLAWSAAIVFFGSVVFMLILGWFADLLFGSSPWGIVVGIIFGSIIGFMQFFRITSRIINPSKSNLQKTPLKLNENQESPNKSDAENQNSTMI